MNQHFSNGLTYRTHPKSGTLDSHGIEIWQIHGCFSAAALPPDGSIDWSHCSPLEARQISPTITCQKVANSSQQELLLLFWFSALGLSVSVLGKKISLKQRHNSHGQSSVNLFGQFLQKLPIVIKCSPTIPALVL